MNRPSVMRPALLLALLPLLGACASSASPFPSLAIRDAERVSGTIDAPAPSPAPTLTPAPAQLAPLLARIREGHAGFLEQVPATRRAVEAARGAASGAEAWSVAQVAVAGLEARRSAVMIALADLDRLYVDGAVGGDDVARLEAGLAEANGLVDAENATVGELLAMLAG